MRALNRAVLGAASILGATATAYAVPPLTLVDARSLSTPELAKQLLGERMASRIIEARRYEYDGGAYDSVPQFVEFFTQPEAPWPQINRICRTDVITIEYNWFDFDEPQPLAPINIFRIQAESRYLAVTEPAGDPGSPEYQRAHEAACASLRSALDAFRAPDAGDAQWLAALEREWSQAVARPRFNLTCDDRVDPSCGSAIQALSRLKLHQARDVERVECAAPRARRRDAVNYCYRLEFPGSGRNRAEWVMTVVGGMRDGMAPVEIRSLRMERREQPIAIH